MMQALLEKGAKRHFKLLSPSLEQWTYVSTMPTAVIRGSQLALEHMRRDRGGRGGIIVNTASIAAAAYKDTCVNPKYMYQDNLALLDRPSELAQAFISMLEDQSSDDVIYQVVAGKGSYRKRQIVDPDGKSNLMTVD
nr:hypothetical protein BaRGS_023645 [Batillaria attramentaria]